jgi:hypothetical protein
LKRLLPTFAVSPALRLLESPQASKSSGERQCAMRRVCRRAGNIAIVSTLIAMRTGSVKLDKTDARPARLHRADIPLPFVIDAGYHLPASIKMEPFAIMFYSCSLWKKKE